MSIENKKLISLFDSIIPIIALVTLLYLNVSIYGDSSLNGSNQLILIIGSSIAFFFGIKKFWSIYSLTPMPLPEMFTMRVNLKNA